MLAGRVSTFDRPRMPGCGCAADRAPPGFLLSAKSPGKRSFCCAQRWSLIAAPPHPAIRVLQNCETWLLVASKIDFTQVSRNLAPSAPPNLLLQVKRCKNQLILAGLHCYRSQSSCRRPSIKVSGGGVQFSCVKKSAPKERKRPFSRAFS